MNINDIEQPFINVVANEQPLNRHSRYTNKYKNTKILSSIIFISLAVVQTVIGSKYINHFTDCSIIISFPTWLVINGTSCFLHLINLWGNMIITADKYPRLKKWNYGVFLVFAIFSLIWWFIGAVIFFYYCFAYLNQPVLIIGYITFGVDFIKLSLIAKYH